jgi:hypothetical protein
VKVEIVSNPVLIGFAYVHVHARIAEKVIRSMIRPAGKHHLEDLVEPVQRRLLSTAAPPSRSRHARKKDRYVT